MGLAASAAADDDDDTAAVLGSRSGRSFEAGAPILGETSEDDDVGDDEDDTDREDSNARLHSAGIILALLYPWPLLLLQ